MTLPFITACDYGVKRGNQLSEKQETPPPFHQKKELSLDDVREIAQKSDKEINITKNYQADNMPAMPSPVVKTAMGGPIGFKTPALFEEKLSNSEARFDRLERVVQDMADKFIKLEPAIDRLVRIDHDLNILTTQLEVLLEKQEGQTQTQPVSDYMAEKANKIIPLAGSKNNNVSIMQDSSMQSLYSIRLSDHANKARIVIDSSGRFDVEPELIDGQLIIRSGEVANADVSSLPIQNLSAVVHDVMQSPQTGDLLFSLTRPVQETKIGRIVPSDDNPDYRTYIDLIF